MWGSRDTYVIPTPPFYILSSKCDVVHRYCPDADQLGMLSGKGEQAARHADRRISSQRHDSQLQISARYVLAVIVGITAPL
jgi:hypothetical protein